MVALLHNAVPRGLLDHLQDLVAAEFYDPVGPLRVDSYPAEEIGRPLEQSVPGSSSDGTGVSGLYRMLSFLTISFTCRKAPANGL